MAEILHHLGCQPNFEIMGVAGGSIKDAIMHDMAGGEILHHLGCQPNFEIMGVAGGETFASASIIEI